MTPAIRRSLVIALVIGLLVVIGLGLMSDLRSVGAGFARFDLALLPLVLGFTILNYVLRWAKWELYLRATGMGNGVSRGASGLLFTAGMVMAVTPAKVGEVLKSSLLRRINGTPISVSAPVVLAERLTDGIAMLLLMSVGLTLYPPAQPLFLVLLVLAVGGLALLQWQTGMSRAFALAGTLPGGARIAPQLKTAYASTRQLLGPQLLAGAILISVVSWFGECIAFYYVLRGLGAEPGVTLLIVATFVFAASTLFGLVSFLPGGLGASEASSAALLILLVPLASGPATTATIIIRICTLWFGVALGALALAAFSRRYPARE